MKRIEKAKTATAKCPECGGKYIKATKYCPSCKKKVKEGQDSIQDIIREVEQEHYIFRSFNDPRIPAVEKYLNENDIPYMTTSQTGNDWVIAGKNSHFYKRFFGESISRTLTVDGIGDTDFLVKYIPTGGNYGRGNSLTASEPLVEFWSTETGQFVSRYAVETLFEDEPYRVGLNLYGGVSDWSVPGREMNKVIDWLGDIEVYGLEEVMDKDYITLPEDVTIDMGDREIILEKGDRVTVIKEGE